MESLTCVEGTMENLRCVHTGPQQTVNMESRVLLCQTSSLSGVVSTSLVTTQHEKPVSDNSLVLCLDPVAATNNYLRHKKMLCLTNSNISQAQTIVWFFNYKVPRHHQTVFSFLSTLTTHNFHFKHKTSINW